MQAPAQGLHGTLPAATQQPVHATGTPPGGSGHRGCRSVNSRFLDLSLFRLPDELRGPEMALREWWRPRYAAARSKRSVSTAGQATPPGWQPQGDQLNRLARLEAIKVPWLPGQAAQPSMRSALVLRRRHGRAPDEAVLRPQVPGEGPVCADARVASRNRAIAQCHPQERIAHLRALAAQAAPLVPAVVQQQQQPLSSAGNEALASAGANISMRPSQERAQRGGHPREDPTSPKELAGNAHLDEIKRLLAKGRRTGQAAGLPRSRN